MLPVVAELLHQDMTRREFLLRLGLLFLALFGLSRFTKFISQPRSNESNSASQTSFGTGGYGV